MTPLYVDTSRGALVVSPVSAQRCLPPVLTIGDTLALSLAFLQRNPQPLNTGTPLYTYQDFSAAGVVFSVGSAGPLPTAGTFTLTWATSTTAPLPYNSSCYDVYTALNALDSISHNGGVSVEGNIGGPFTVRFLTPAVRQAFTVDATNLYPAASAAVAINTAGTTTTTAQQTIALSQIPATSVASWSAQAAPAVTVTAIQGTVIQQITIPQGTYGGVFTLTINGLTTPALPFNAQFDLIQSTINTLLSITNCTVLAGQNTWFITIPGNSFAFTGTGTGLQIPLTLTGVLNLTSPALLPLLAGEPCAQVPFAIQSTASGVQTIYAGTVQLNTGPVSGTTLPLPAAVGIFPEPAINGITGTSDSLDKTVTAGGAVAVGTIFVLTLTVGGLSSGEGWQLIASPPASNGETSQRPLDYNASTNNVGWIQIW